MRGSFWPPIFAPMKRERKTVQVETCSGRVVWRTPKAPKPPKRIQRYRMRPNGFATVRLTLTREQYEHAKAASKVVAAAMGYARLSLPDAIVMVASVSAATLAGHEFRPFPTPAQNLRGTKLPGRPPKFKDNKAAVILIMTMYLADELTSCYDRYAELRGVEYLPSTGPVWEAFLHGVEVIRAALGRG